MEEAGSVGVKSTKLACRRRFLASALLAPGAGPGHAGPEGWDALRGLEWPSRPLSPAPWSTRTWPPLSPWEPELPDQGGERQAR